MCKNLLSDHLHHYSIKKLQIPFEQKTPCHCIGKFEIEFSDMSYNILLTNNTS